MTGWSSSEIAGLVAVLGGMAPAHDQVEAVARVRALEEVKAACAAAQARETARLYELREAAEAAAGVPAGKRCQGVASEVALARRESPSRGSRYVGLARALVDELPHTMAAMSEGRLSEWRATLVARETAWLGVGDRGVVDAALAPRLTGLSDARLAAEARALAQKLDGAGAVAQLRRKEGERRVSLRPAPDAMAYLTALLPMREAVATYGTLLRDAQTQLAMGDPEGRTKAQLMADLLVGRVTGTESARELPVEVGVVMTDGALFGKDETPAHLPGHGPIPAALARAWLDPASTESVFLRRLFTRPGSGELVGMDSRRRTFDGQLRQMILLRDDVCATPYCGAPIRHIDHTVPVREGGQTTYENASGRCERCNYVKEHPGWTTTSTGGTISVTTPTGLTEHAPPPLLLPGTLLNCPGQHRYPAPAGGPGPVPDAVQDTVPGGAGPAREGREDARRAAGLKPALRSSWCQFQASPGREAHRLAEALTRRGWNLTTSSDHGTRDRGTHDTDDGGDGSDPSAR
ncbi:MAG TPA: DUF222 domain-containing protein [Actinomycetales bacterium]|nr:DUF222 domain-containing protein [Actinomycetales bacterium]